MTEATTDLAPVASPSRAPTGQFVAGVSGNPAGRPPGRKSEITAVKQDLELALRTHVDAKKIARIIDKIVNKAMNGNLQAAKLILDKVLPNAGETDDTNSGAGGVRFIIENATFAAPEAARPRVIIDATSSEVPSK
jgi:hypothetical protein